MRRVSREEIIDKNIVNIVLPEDFKMEEVVGQWLKNNGINSNDVLKNWLKDNGLEIEQWKKFVASRSEKS